MVLRGNRIVLPQNLRSMALKLAHMAHVGMQRMKQTLRSYVWWLNMNKMIEEFVDSCYNCKLVAPNEPPKPMMRHSLSNGPWMETAADLFGPMESGEHIRVVIDYYSRYPEVVLLIKIKRRNQRLQRNFREK